MTPERWLKVQEIFAEALERGPVERVSYLSGVCTDASLRQEVELMIAAHEQGESSFLEPAGSKETLKSGARIGSYEVLGPLGAGGMGEVYRARDTKLGRDVAIKVLPAAFARDVERLARFQREAKFLASLNHPNIASIYGLEDSGNIRALVMELVEGPTLADRIKAGPIPMDEALSIAKQICEALEYAHERGVVHRDLKPANIKISPEGSVKILDFGLAKAVQGEAEATSAGDSPTLSQMATRAGVLLGTAGYMSPEQAKGKPVDRRADIWAFGCVLYEMLTAKKAFQTDTTTETLAAVLKNEPDWSPLPPATPMHVRVLLHRCLQKDAKQRLRDIGDARISLDEVLSGSAESATGLMAVAPVWRRVLPWAIAGATTLALAVLAFYHFRGMPPAPAQLLRYEILLPAKSILSNATIELSPDGKHLAFAAESQGVRQLWVHDLNSLVSRPLPGTEGAGVPIWSPDSRSIAFHSGNELERVDISGGGLQTICNVGDVMGGSWGPDGTIVFGSSNGGLMRVSASGGSPSPLTGLATSSGGVMEEYPSFLPDGRHFLYIFQDGHSPWWSTRLGSLVPGENLAGSKPLVGGNGLYAPAFGSAPAQIVFQQSNGTLMAQAFNPSRARIEGDPIPIADDVEDFTVSADILAYTGRGTVQDQLTWFDRRGKVLGTVGEPGEMQPRPALSPDGRTVAVARRDLSTGKADIWLYDLARGAQSRFTFEGGEFPVWSPDGSHIAFFSTSEGASNVYEKEVNGIGEAEVFEKATGNPRAPQDWSRDGRYLIEETPNSFWVLPLSVVLRGGGRKSFPFSDENVHEAEASLSPNGRWVAYQSDKTGRAEIYVETFPRRGGLWQVSVNGGTSPVWSRDGKELYFIDPDGKLMAVEVESGPGGVFVAGAPKALFDSHIFRARESTFAVSKDGRFLIPATVEQSGATNITVVVNWQAALKK